MSLNKNRQERAVLYCRVSTADELQRSSLNAQQAEGKRIAEERGWKLIKVLAEQETGTNIESRPQYQEMLRMIRKEEVDIVIVKSIDRLNRKEADWYDFLNLISKHDVRLFQMLENRFYDGEQDALLSGIKAILAAEYSRELSKKINRAHRYRQEHTHHVVLSSRTYALKSHGGIVTVDENEAVMVRRAYELMAEGYSSSNISRILFSEGFSNRNGNRLNATTITRIITNPLFKGTAVFNKRRYDFEKKKIIYTDPKEWIVAEHAVPQIVPEELWEKANRMVGLRIRVPNQPYELIQKNQSLSLKGKVYCGICGAPYYRCFVRGKGKENSGKAKYIYRCKTYKYEGKSAKCDNIFVPEDDLANIVNEVGQQLGLDKTAGLWEEAILILEGIITVDENAEQIIEIEKELEQKKTEKYNALRLHIKKPIDVELFETILSDIDAEISSLEKEKIHLQSKWSDIKMEKNRMKDLREMIPTLKEVFCSRMTLENIDKVLIFPDSIRVSVDRQMIEFPAVKWVHTMHFERQLKYTKIMELINENPRQTVKQMAESIDVPLQTVQNWILAMRRSGLIRYNRAKGSSCWEVLKKL